MHCPNCGSANPDNAKFCANCGTSFGSTSQEVNSNQNQPQYQASAPYQSPGPYQSPIPAGTGNTVAKNIGIGCLIAIVVVLLFGLSCTRACFGLRHRTHFHRVYH